MSTNHQDPSTYMQVDQKENSMVVRDETQNGPFPHAQSIIYSSKKLQDDLHMLGLKIKHHEDNINMLKNYQNKLDDSILDMQVVLGKYHSSTSPDVENDDQSTNQSEEETTEKILRHEDSAAGILCELKGHLGSQTNQAMFSNVLGIVATLGRVEDDNLGRLLSEYLGLDNMLAIVCKSYESMKALESYKEVGVIDKDFGLHGFGASIAKPLNGRFVVICLEHLRPYCGEFVADDPQRRLDILKPKLRNGESPPGFIGYAVNMINVEPTNLFYLTASGYGLRETLFYSLFSHLQVYKTRESMLSALPCIKDGAISLDGGMIKRTGFFYLGNQNDVDVRFPKPSVKSNLPDKFIDAEKQLKEMKWKKEKLVDDVKREQTLLVNAKHSFGKKKEEFVKFLAESSSYATQHQIMAAREKFTPR